MTPTSSSSSNCRIWWDASISAYRLTTPFNRELVDTFKTLVPGSDRAFDPTTKIWTFTEKWLAPTVKLIETVTRSKPQVVTRMQVEQAASGASGGPNAAQRTVPIDTVLSGFMRLIPYEAALKAYRHAALLMHPDRGGDMTKMSTLNTSWDRISKEIYGQ